MTTANTALQTIEQQGNNSDLMPSKGEALLCRAYAALTLANTFCMAYDPTTASKNLGLPYPTRPETTVGTKYERGTLAAFYEQINRDIEEGLPTPSLHFSTYTTKSTPRPWPMPHAFWAQTPLRSYAIGRPSTPSR